jgi:hypothetical protein
MEKNKNQQTSLQGRNRVKAQNASTHEPLEAPIPQNAVSTIRTSICSRPADGFTLSPGERAGVRVSVNTIRFKGAMRIQRWRLKLPTDNGQNQPTLNQGKSNLIKPNQGKK